jgi:hypothetical protein
MVCDVRGQSDASDIKDVRAHLAEEALLIVLEVDGKAETGLERGIVGSDVAAPRTVALLEAQPVDGVVARVAQPDGRPLLGLCVQKIVHLRMMTQEAV